MTEVRLIWMLIALCAGVFLVTSAGASTAPFLNFIAKDLSTSLPAVAHLFSIQALTWGISSLIAGLLADRFQRKRILVAGIFLIGMMRLGFSSADTYAAAVTWQVLSGIGGGAFMGLVYAVVSEHAAPEVRGRAMSWVITGQSLSLVLGVPLVTLLGTVGGWRGAIATHGACVILAAIGVHLATPADPGSPPHAQRKKTPYGMLFKPKLMALLAAGTTERLCFAIVAIFLPAYLQHAYDTPLGGLALVLALVAAGNLTGNILGGRIADKTRSRPRVFAIGSACTAVVALPLLAWHPGLAVSVALGFVYSFVNAAGRPSLMATLAEVPSEIRSALFGLNITMASLGWLMAGSVGGTLLALGSFEALGAFAAGTAELGCVLALFSASRPGSSPSLRAEK